jgi:hypothetical protein
MARNEKKTVRPDGAPSHDAGSPGNPSGATRFVPPDQRVLVAGLLRQAWIGLAFWMSFGLLLEGLIGYRIPDYLNDPQRRELFRLAHAHGGVLSLVLLAAALGLGFGVTEPPRKALLALRIGVVVMPVSFLLAGIWHYSNDPGLAIWLVAPAALLVVFGIVGLALAIRRP